MSEKFLRRRDALRAADITAPAPTSILGPATLQQVVHKVHVRDQKARIDAAKAQAEQEVQAVFAGQISELRARRAGSSAGGGG